MSYTPALNTILLGAPKAPNPTAGDNSNRIATASFVNTQINNSLTTGDFVGRTTAQTITGLKTLQTGAATAVGLAVRATGDTADRVTLNNDGSISFGGGSTATDVKLLRSTTNQLSTTAGMTIGGMLTARSNTNGVIYIGDSTSAPTISFGANADTVIVRSAAGILTMGAGHQFRVQQDPVNANDLARKQYVDNTVSSALTAGDYVTRTTAQTVTGAKTFSAEILANGAVAAIRGTTGSETAYRAARNGDPQNRYRVSVDGGMEWGAGAAAADVTLSRAAAGILSLGAGHQLRVQQDPVDASDLARKAYVDAEIDANIAAIDTTNYVTKNGAQTITGAKTFTTSPVTLTGAGAWLELNGGSNLYIEGQTAGSQVFASGLAGDAGDNRFQLNAGGELTWGSGAAVRDVNLYRNAAGALRTNGELYIAQGLYVEGSGGLNFGLDATARLTRTGAGVIGVVGKIQQGAVPTQDQDLVNKAYVDAAARGLDQKASVRAATTGPITLTGTQTIDGVTVVAGDRVLVKDQADAATNGIYAVAAGAWARTADADSDAEVSSGLFTFVSEGTVNGNNGFTLITDDPITVGTTALTFTQSSGAGQITAGNGLVKTGNTIDVQGTAGRITINADSVDIASGYIGQTSITTLGTIGTGTWNGSAVDVLYGGTGATSVAGAQANLDIVTTSTGQMITGDKNFIGSVIMDGQADFFGTTNVHSAFNVMAASGGIRLLDPANGADIILSRLAANTLGIGTGNQIRVDVDPVNANDLARKAYVDAQISGANTTASSTYVTLSTAQTITGAKTFGDVITSTRGTGGDVALLVGYTAQASAFRVTAGGTLGWYSSGGAAIDTTLSRVDAGVLALGLGQHIRGYANPVTADDLARKGYVDSEIDANIAAIDYSNFVNRTDAQTVGGTKTFTSTTTFDWFVNFNNDIQATAGVEYWKRGAAAEVALRTTVGAEDSNRFVLQADGTLNWGAGGAAGVATDVTLSRVLPNVLQLGTGDALRVMQDPVDGNDVTRRSYVDNAISSIDLTDYVTKSTDQTITGAKTFSAVTTLVSASLSGIATFNGGGSYLRFVQPANTRVIDAQVTGEAENRFELGNTGAMFWGAGTTTPDVSLARGGANFLQLGAGDALRIQQDPVDNNDVARKAYVDTQVAAARALGTTTVTAATTLTTNHEVVLVNATGAVTVTLPDTHTDGTVIHIKDISGNAETNNVTIATGGGDTIDGQATAAIVMNYQNVTVVSNGTNWFII